jgi:uncharacterized membrane protein YphA (DoxX/SURF4 family)
MHILISATPTVLLIFFSTLCHKGNPCVVASKNRHHLFKESMKRSVFISVACCILSFLFLYTGISKALSLPVFTSTLRHIPLVGILAPVLAFLIIIIEITIAILLLIDSTQKQALWISLVLLVGFTVYIAGLLLFASQIPCSCGGVISSMSWQQHLLFNLFFIVLCATAIKSFMHENRTSRKPG